MDAETVSLAEAYPVEQARVRELLGVYKSIGPVGTFGAMMIERVLQRADSAAADHDTVAMLRSYQEMKGCK